jgi:putative membrane protein
MFMRNKQLLWLAIALTTAGCTTMEAQIHSSGALSQVDKDYATEAYQLVQLDNQAGKLAVTKAGDPRVQDIASQIMTQADTLSPDLRSALKVEGITPPSKLSRQTAAEIETLRGLSGAAFDHQYVADEIAAHQQAVAIFQKEDTATKNDAMRTEVETELPAVQGNLDKLQALSGGSTPANG